MRFLRNSVLLCLLVLQSFPAAAVTITRAVPIDLSGMPRDRFSTSERIGLRIEVDNSGPEVDRIDFRFSINDPSGRRVFYHDGNSTPGRIGRSASQLTRIPLTFYTGAGTYVFRAEAVVDGAVRSQRQSYFSIHSPVVTLLYPPAGSRDLIDSPLVFRWVSSGAARYRVQVSEDEGFHRPIWSGETIVASISYPAAPSDDRQKLRGGTVYYWRVQGFDDTGVRIASSDAFSFTVHEESGAEFSRNLGVSNIFFNGMLSSFPDSVVFTAEIVNTGSTHESETDVRLFIGGRQAGVQRIPLILPGSRGEVNFNIGRFLDEYTVVSAALDILDDDSRDNILTKNVVVGLPDEWKGVPKIMGRVVDGITGMHLRGARVTLSGAVNRSAETDSNGRYVFEKLLPGSYTITVSLEGYRDHAPVTVAVDQERAYPLGPIDIVQEAVSAEEHQAARIERDYTPASAWEVIGGSIDRAFAGELDGYRPVKMEITPGADINYVIERIRTGRARIRGTRIEIR